MDSLLNQAYTLDETPIIYGYHIIGMLGAIGEPIFFLILKITC